MEKKITVKRYNEFSNMVFEETISAEENKKTAVEVASSPEIYY